MAGETLRFDVVGDASSAARAFRQTAEGALLASRGARQLSDSLGLQSKSAQVSAAATLALAKSDKTLRDAQVELAIAEGKLTRAQVAQAVATDEARRQLESEGRAADVAAAKLVLAGKATDLNVAKLRLAADSAQGAGAGFSALATPMGAAVAAGVALAPVIATVGLGLGGLGLAALTASKNTAQMNQVLAPLKTEFSAFSASLQPEVFTLFGQGVSIASHVLKDIQPIAAATGKALSLVLGQVDQAFQSNTWQNFFGFMEQNAGPDIKLLGDAIVNLINTLPGLLESLQPVATLLLQTADGATKVTAALGKLTTASQAQKDTQAALNAQHQTAITQIPILGTVVSSIVNHFTHADQVTSDYAQTTKTAATSADSIALSLSTAQRATKLASGATAELTLNQQIEALTAKDVVKAQDRLNQAWATFLSFSTNLVTAQLGVNQNLKTMTADAKTAGASFTGVNDASQKLQQDLEGNLVPGVQNVIGSMRTAHASTKDLALVVATDLKPAVDAGALSNKAMRQQIFDMAVEAGYAGPNQLKPLRDWFNRNAGSAQNAADKVAGLSAKLAALPSGKSIGITVRLNAKGGINAVVTAPGIASVQGGGHLVLGGLAAGGMVTGGIRGKDSVVAALTPGEVVVPAKMVSAGAVDHLRGQLPGFAAGGLIGAVNWTGSHASAFAESSGEAFARSALAAFRKSAAAVPGAGLSSSASIRAEQLYALSLFPNFGWGAGQLPPLIALWNRESGWNPDARNPASGAFGIPQALPPSKMGILGSTWAGQILWGEGYIKGRYGTPAAAWAHEVSAGWYDRGGFLKPGLTLAYNGTGRPEPVLPAGSAVGGSVTVVLENRGVIGSEAELENWLHRRIDALARQGKLRWAFRQSPSA